ncbi:MAG: precorrin-8X methylmutase [Egibacteraceae bacterium]
MRPVHPIEAESYRRLRAAVDLSGLAPLSRAVAERVIHASADLEYARDLVLDEDALRQGRSALQAGAPVVVDTRMVAAGLNGLPVHCGLDGARPPVRGDSPQPPARGDSPQPPADGQSRSAAGIRRAAARAGAGAVYVIGCAPTALVALLDLDAEPALVIGLPVGFVGAVEAKQALRQAGLPACTNRGPKGGSAVAAAALNALRYWEAE